MGWVPPEHLPSHEGFLVAHVERVAGSGLFRELAYPEDKDARPVVRLSAGCDCGWRSGRWATDEAEWHPFSVFAQERDQEAGLRLWQAHIGRLGPHSDWLTQD